MSSLVTVQLPGVVEGTIRTVAMGFVRQIAAHRGDAHVDAIARIRSASTLRLSRGTPSEAVAAFFVSVICDLSIQGWSVAVVEDAVSLTAPAFERGTADEAKARIRASHLIERDRQLDESGTRRFVAEMEEARIFNGEWISVFSLMRDGRELSSLLREATVDTTASLAGIVDPYLQIVDSEATCKETGLRLADVWRYFRYTWSSAFQSVPGRRMHVIVRDRAAKFHPVIGIAALGSSVVQMSVRDEWIGWSSSAVINQLRSRCTDADARHFVDGLNSAIDDVYKADFLREGLVTRRELVRPTERTRLRLEGEARRSRRAHERYPNTAAHKANVPPHDVDWKQRAETFLFRSKRATLLGSLLESRRVLSDLFHGAPRAERLEAALSTNAGRRAISLIIKVSRAEHVGINMLDVTSCGAIAPYNHLLGGKLVALLLFSPELVRAHTKRYRQSASLIASSMKGELVVRRPRLVLLATTSLYGRSSSQYNRLRIPRAALEPHASGDLEYSLLGRTEGFGSYHFSQATVELAEIVASQSRAGRRVNSIFGEGVSPKLRKLRQALERGGFPADRVLRHGSSRLVYGAALARNFRDVLQGRSRKPEYLLHQQKPAIGTSVIAEFWRERWLRMRASQPGILSAVASETLIYPINHGARVKLPASTLPLPLFEFAEG